ncbi:MAG: sensor domain-containing diguanylate cyclase [Gammaproteobacteria bacterium]|nr:sensor domain-containing diguanylate cyclase [Gammaproteobacteria bacterium]
MSVPRAPENTKTINEKASQIYNQAPISNLAIISIAFIFYFLLRDYSQSSAHLVWPALLTIAALYRLSLWYRKKYLSEQHSSNWWLNHYTIATAATGLVWGSVFLLPYVNHDFFLYIGLIMILFGVTASAVSILSVSLVTFFVYTLPIVTCFGAAIYFLKGSEAFIFILATTIYYGMLSLFARNTNQHILKSIKLEYYNQDLIQKLQSEIDNRELLIQERTRELNQSHQALTDSKNQLQNVIDGATLGYWDWEYQTGHHQVNDRWLDILGLDRNDINNDVSDWSNLIHPDDQTRITSIVEDSIEQQKPFTSDFRMKHKDGHWIWIQGSGALIESDPETNEPLRLCGTHQDISYRKEIEKKLKYQAKHDGLTGLYNRVELEKQFQLEIIRAKRYHLKFSVLMIDIDHFKKINDTHGHQIGDQTLKQFSDFLKITLRTTDYIARYGGEEFIIILPETTREKAIKMAERLRLKTTTLIINKADTNLNITISIGVASYPDSAQSYDKLLEVADAAMYNAKHNGRNRVHLS